MDRCRLARQADDDDAPAVANHGDRRVEDGCLAGRVDDDLRPARAAVFGDPRRQASSPAHSAANPHEPNSFRRAATGSSTSTSAPRSAAARAAAAPIGPAPSTTTSSPAATRPRLMA